MISRDASRDNKLNSLSMEAQLLYLLTVPHLDRDGLVDGDPILLWSSAAPRRLELLDRTRMLEQEWVDIGLVIRYRGHDGDILFFPGFRRHNAGLEYEKEEQSRFPPPPGYLRSPHGLIPECREEAGRLAGSFHQSGRYYKALIQFAETGKIDRLKAFSRSSRERVESSSGSSRREDQDQDQYLIDDDDQSSTPHSLGFSNRGGVGGGGADGSDGMSSLSDKALAVVAYDLGGQLNLVTEWRNYQGYVLGLSRDELMRLIRWIYYYTVAPEETIEAIKSMPAVVQAHMKKGETAAFTTRQRRELGSLVEKSLKLNESDTEL
jgi:hypothetical protein